MSIAIELLDDHSAVRAFQSRSLNGGVFLLLVVALSLSSKHMFASEINLGCNAPASETLTAKKVEIKLVVLSPEKNKIGWFLGRDKDLVTQLLNCNFSSGAEKVQTWNKLYWPVWGSIMAGGLAGLYGGASRLHGDLSYADWEVFKNVSLLGIALGCGIDYARYKIYLEPAINEYNQSRVSVSMNY